MFSVWCFQKGKAVRSQEISYLFFVICFIRDDLYQALMNLKVSIEEYLATVKKKDDVDKANEHLSKQLELLQTALKDKLQKHPLYTLQDR